MSRLGSYELTHPELFSEQQLHEILRNSCIENLSLGKLDKSELLNIYKQVAMPLPQRQGGSIKGSNAEVDIISERTISNDDMHNSTTSLDKGSKRISQAPHEEADRLKLPFNNQKSIPKKIRLCSIPKLETVYNGINKRRCDEQNEESLIKKRQKITWP